MPTAAQRRTARSLDDRLSRLGNAWSAHQWDGARAPVRFAPRVAEAKAIATALADELAPNTDDQSIELRNALRYVADCADMVPTIEKDGLSAHFEGMAIAIGEALSLASL